MRRIAVGAMVEVNTRDATRALMLWLKGRRGGRRVLVVGVKAACSTLSLAGRVECFVLLVCIHTGHVKIHTYRPCSRIFTVTFSAVGCYAFIWMGSVR